MHDPLQRLVWFGEVEPVVAAARLPPRGRGGPDPPRAREEIVERGEVPTVVDRSGCRRRSGNGFGRLLEPCTVPEHPRKGGQVPLQPIP